MASGLADKRPAGVVVSGFGHPVEAVQDYPVALLVQPLDPAASRDAADCRANGFSSHCQLVG
jgi:hypothetical protein